jgi:ABC-type multidrug transport system ATPase subunit
MKNKSIILVTHQMHFIKANSKILYLSGGECLAIGNFDELLKSGIDFVSIMKKQNRTIDNENVNNKCDTDLDISYEDSSNDMVYERNHLEIEDESKLSEEINLKLYYEYFKSGSGPFLIAIALLSTIGTEFLFHFTDYWLTFW